MEEQQGGERTDATKTGPRRSHATIPGERIFFFFLLQCTRSLSSAALVGWSGATVRSGLERWTSIACWFGKGTSA